jgi:aryl-alcohol dehydrogenase-like predicted oxidoreductase
MSVSWPVLPRKQKLKVRREISQFWPDRMASQRDDDAPQMRGRFPEAYLRDNIENSLKRLGMERIDLFRLHSFTPVGLVELDWLETLLKRRSEGNIDGI